MKESIRRFIHDKGTKAYSDLSSHFSHPASATDRAVFRREVVRRYNGQKEFRWNANKKVFEIHPSHCPWEKKKDHSKGANSRFGYCNKVLGTHVVYSHGAGENTTFPFPITFTADMYGPDL